MKIKHPIKIPIKQTKIFQLKFVIINNFWNGDTIHERNPAVTNVKIVKKVKRIANRENACICTRYAFVLLSTFCLLNFTKYSKFKIKPDFLISSSLEKLEGLPNSSLRQASSVKLWTGP